MDGDGHPDIVVSSWVGPVSVLMADGDGGFAGAAAYPLDTTANVRDVVVADLNGDGAPEVVVAGGRVQGLPIDGDSALPSRWQTGTTYSPTFISAAVVRDLDGDAHGDCLMTRRSGGYWRPPHKDRS